LPGEPANLTHGVVVEPEEPAGLVGVVPPVAVAPPEAEAETFPLTQDESEEP
jgi:hypothetical protein